MGVVIPVGRREFLGQALAAGAVAAQPRPIPVLDTHIHLFDPTRPQGVPWPSKNNTILYKPAVPSRYREVIRGLGVTGAIETECSPWLEDNQWVLDACEKDTIMVGTVGNLEPGKPEFRQHLERFHRNPLFRGIRYGNLWRRDLTAALGRPEFVADLKFMAQAGLSLDTADPTVRLLQDVVHLTDLVPTLRVIFDHLPTLPTPTEAEALLNYKTAMRELGKRPQVYVKVSQVVQRVGGRVPLELSVYRAKLDEIFETYGPDRLLYASDWPNSDQWAPYPQVLALVQEYFLAKGREIAEKYFWKNSVAAYRWVRRAPSQPDPATV